ncbi:uncharacterized protein [Amphiura filiformis]|uniref:uncharacterized protein n=1 Tax=Amphiura filiformis TaxID=82378 RepID=UPI003B21DCA8
MFNSVNPPALPVVTFKKAVYAVDEGSTVTLTITRGDDGSPTPTHVALKITLLNAANEDFILDVLAVSVYSCGEQTLEVSGLSDDIKENLELFMISIVENAALYNIGKHSVATVYVTDINSLLCPLGYCLNGGECFDTDTTIYCQCADGYEGDQCERPTVLCPLGYCLNGGECFDTDTTIYCQCADGYEGDQCERPTGLSSGAIAAISVGAIIGLITIAAAVTCCLRMVYTRVSAPKSPSSTANPGFPPINNPNFGNMLTNSNAILADGTSLQYPYQPNIY